MAAAKKEAQTIEIVQVDTGKVTFCLLGQTPLILNRMSEKAMHELLLPKGRKTKADKASGLKHDPYAEFLASPYTDPNPEGETLLMHLACAFKRGIAEAALDAPGSSKAQIGRLTWVIGERLPIFGVPQMMMSVVRSADVAKTPDIRTRVVVPKWATMITVQFIKPMLNEKSIAALVAMSGLTQGTGDWRTGKGKGTYGAFSLVSEDDPEFKHILKHGRRDVQVEAMRNPGFYDQETEDLFRWFNETIEERGKGELISKAGVDSIMTQEIPRPVKTAPSAAS